MPTGEVGMESVIGVDLSGLSRSTKGRTVAAQVALEDPIRLVGLKAIRYGQAGDVELLDWIAARRPRVVGIDAPLSLPHSVLCESEECERCKAGDANYLSRDVDRMVGGMPMVMLAAIAFRGMYLARQLLRRNIHVIEVYPGVAYQSWGIRHATSDALAKTLIGRVGRFDWSTRDELDAVCAAVVTSGVLTGDTRAIRGIDGEIAIPGPRPSGQHPSSADRESFRS